MSLLEAYNQYDYKDFTSLSTFYKYVESEYNKPHRLSDLCENFKGL